MENKVILSDSWKTGMMEAVTLASNERVMQLKKWGIRTYKDNDLPTWMTILGEEYGELCEKVLEYKFDGPHLQEGDAIELRDAMKQEAIQVAAVALAIIQFVETGEA